MFVCLFVCVRLCISVGIVAIGFFDRDKKTWIRVSSVHAIDFVALLVTIAEYASAWLGEDIINLRAFRVLRIVRAFCRVPGLQGVQTLVESLSQGMTQLSIVVMMLFFFLSSLSVWAMAIFTKSMRRRCVVVEKQVRFLVESTVEFHCREPRARSTRNCNFH